MRHPIYNTLPTIVLEVARNYVPGQKKSEDGVDGIVDIFRQQMGSHVSTEEVEGSVGMLRLQILMVSSIIAHKHTHIDATYNDWGSKLSAKTIGALQVGNFKCPFPSGTIATKSRVYMFTADENGLIFSMLNDTELDTLTKKKVAQLDMDNQEEIMAVYEDTEDASMEMGAVPIAVIPNTGNNLIRETIDVPFLGEINEKQEMEIYSLLSILMYIAMSNSSTEGYGEAVKTKIVKGKPSRKLAIPKHLVNIINVRQRIRSGTGHTFDRSVSTKTWIVRGHWRNQYYSKLDEHHTKWIDPYFKGSGKDEAQKIYKI